MAAGFHYEQRLSSSQIRLLHIHPGRVDEALQCDIVTRDLTDEVEYTALSYVWGSDTARNHIICNGQIVEVTKSLHGALVRYRASGRTSLLWADAHCINQYDDIEKSEQVEMMAQIYERARLVIVWLGEALSSDAAGLHLAQKLHGVFAYHEADAASFTAADFETAGVPVSNPDYWKAFMNLLGKPWFRRVWIMQEFINAKECMMWCGQLRFHPEIILLPSNMLAKQRHSAVIAAALEHDSMLPFVRLLGDAGVLRSLKNALGPRGYRNCRLVALLWPLRAWRATDPRDKVFALVGLADGVPDGFIDYTLSFYQVYVQAAKFVLLDNHLNPLVMLSYATAGERSDLPSWVPSWTRNKQNRTPLASRYRLFTPPSELLEPRAEYSFMLDDVCWELLAIKETLCADSETGFGRQGQDHRHHHKSASFSV